MENTLVLTSRQQHELQLVWERFVRVVKGLAPSDIHALLLFYGEEVLDLLSSGLAIDVGELRQLTERVYHLGRNPQLQTSLIDDIRDLRESLQSILRQAG